MYGLDLFSGIGGLTKALEPWVRPVAYCENDRHAQAILLSRMSDGRLPLAPIWSDVRTLRGEDLPRVDIVYGGFPCQDISVAGRGAGLAGERSGLFFEIIRLAKEIKPQFVFLENVPRIRTRGLDRIIHSFFDIGYDCRWDVLSAKEVKAGFDGKRWFLLASPYGKRLERLYKTSGGKYLQQTETDFPQHDWQAAPRVLGANHGIPHAMDRIRALGNSVVPQQAREAFKRLSGLGEINGIA